MIFNGIKGNADEISKLIKKGCVGVIPTDTLYGFSCSALDKNAVERIYKIKGRDESKPFIILISSLEDLSKFNIQLDLNTKEFLENIFLGFLGFEKRASLQGALFFSVYYSSSFFLEALPLLYSAR